VDELTQAKYVVRMWLLNAAAGVPTSIAYDWRNDGSNSSDCESNFGSVRSAPTGNASMPFEPKPFYTAALTAQQGVGSAAACAGFLPAASSAAPASDVFLVGFTGYERADHSGSGSAFAAWSNSTASGVAVTFSVASAATPGVPPNACFHVQNVLGQASDDVCAVGGIVALTLSDGPLYLL
jgi:hypothetical protein